MPCALFGGGRRRPGRPVPPETGGDPLPSGVVGRIAITPASLALQVGQSVQMTAVGYDSITDTPIAGVPFTWQSTVTGVATVDVNGLVTAVGAGTTQILASAPGAVQSAPSPCQVAPPAVASVVLTPNALAGLAGGSGAFTAQALDAQGRVMTGKTFSVSTSNAGIATAAMTGSAGAVTFVGAGSATLTVTCDGVTAPLTVTVSAALGSRPNEPGGMTQRTRNTFAGTSEDSWVPRAADLTSGAQSIQATTDPASPLVLLGSGTAPVSGPSVLQARYSTTLQAGSGPIQTQRNWAGSGLGDDELYVDLWVQFSTNFHNGYAGMSGTSKLLFCELDLGNQLVLGFQGFRLGALRPRISLQAGVRSPTGRTATCDNGTDGAFGVTFGPTLARGVWHRFVLYLKKNTTDPLVSGVWDGICRCWVNPTAPGGVPDFERTHVGYVGGGGGVVKPITAKWNQVKINPTWSGGTANGTDGAQPGGTSVAGTTTLGSYGPVYVWYDDLYVSGK